MVRQKTMFVHGVSPRFLEVGKKKAEQAEMLSKDLVTEQEQDNVVNNTPVFPKDLYFIGKVLWGKGYTELVDLLSYHANKEGKNLHVDVYGSGVDLQSVVDEANKRKLDIDFHPGRDHVDPVLQDYKVFVNPSLSDVVATTTAEALAMGKFVVCADHPANAFFSTFPNCLIYHNPEEFSQQVSKALESKPTPLSEEDQKRLTWEAATGRFLDATELADVERAKGIESFIDNVCWAIHNSLSGVEQLRVLAGAGANTRDNPQRIVDFDPSASDVGGFLDSKKRIKQT